MCGPTGERLRHHGRRPASVVHEFVEALTEQAATGRPVAVMNAPFGLTLLNRKLRRHRASSLGRGGLSA